MIAPLALALIAQSSPFSRSVDAASAALNRTPSGRVSIRIVSKDKQNRSGTTSTMEVAWIRPAKLLLRIREPRMDSSDATDRSYFLSGSTILAVDHRAGEVLRRPTLAQGGMLERIEAVLGNVGEPLQCAVSGTHLKAILSRFSAVEPTVARIGGFERWTAVSADRTLRTEIVFDARKRLTKVSARQGETLLDWTFAYSAPPKSLSLAIPPGARQVNQFTARPAPPKFADRAVSAAFARAEAAYDRLAHAAMEIAGGAEPSAIWISNRRFREQQPAFRWILANGQAVLIDTRRRKAYKGKVGGAELIDAVGSLGYSVQPIMRNFLLRTNPLRTLFTNEFTLRSIGSLTLQGRPCQVVGIDGRFWKGSMLLDERTGLMAQLTAKAVDSQGRTVSTSVVDYRLKSIGSPLPDELFRLEVPKGMPVLPIQGLLQPVRP